jgi:hypothetical protein
VINFNLHSKKIFLSSHGIKKIKLGEIMIMQEGREKIIQQLGEILDRKFKTLA